MSKSRWSLKTFRKKQFKAEKQAKPGEYYKPPHKRQEFKEWDGSTNSNIRSY